MGTRVVAFCPEHLEAVARFSEHYWTRPRSASYYRWRYIDSLPFMQMVIALDDQDTCVATVSALRKTYRVKDQQVSVLEVFDWHCFPELRGSGVGIRVMRALMRLGEPLLSVGGTKDAVSTMAAMKWLRIASARQFRLPLAGQVLAEAVEGRTGIPAGLLRGPLGLATYFWFKPKRRYRSTADRALFMSALGDEITDLYRGETGYGAVQIPQPVMLRWMTASYPANAHFVLLAFRVEDAIRGWSLAKIYTTQLGVEADILDLFAPVPDIGLYTWMVSESASVLARFSPRSIRARATCLAFRAALLANRFHEEKIEDIPVHFWSKNGVEDLGRIHVTLNHGDAPLRPFSPAAGGAGFPAP